MPQPFNPKRLTVARRRRGLTKSALARDIEVSLRMVTAYERGEKEPGPLSLTRLADRLEFPQKFFFGPDMEGSALETSSFRALSTMTARQRGQAFGSGYIALLLANWIDDRFNLPKPALPKLRGIDVETASLAVRSEWGLGQRPIPNLIHLLEAHGVRVFSLVEECRELDAFSFWRGDVPYMFLNTMKSAEHSRMDASHELGHLTLHWKEGARGRDAEKEAEMFGAMFLMPSDDVRAQSPRRASLNDIIKTKHRWNTSAAALTRRLKDVGLLTDWRYRSLFIEMSRKGYRTLEPEASRPETSKLLAKVFKTLREEGVTKADIARELDILPEELEKLIFGLVLTPVESATDNQRQSAEVERPTLRLI